MTIEKTTGGGTMITGDDISVYRLFALKGALKLEIAGMSRRGPSAATILKKEFGWKGNNKKILGLLEEHLKHEGDT
jgi:hypothetical protein